MAQSLRPIRPAMDENYDLLPEFELDILRKERPTRAKVQKAVHSLRHEIADLGYFIEAETTIGTREYYIIRLDDPNRVYIQS
jgi:hypothetical protein